MRIGSFGSAGLLRGLSGMGTFSVVGLTAPPPAACVSSCVIRDFVLGALKTNLVDFVQTAYIDT